ncbi:MAG TPA: hypothetical protein VI142_05660, partial [Gaiellaceae bacterium]
MKLLKRARAPIVLIVGLTVILGTVGVHRSSAESSAYTRVLFSADFDSGPLVYAPGDPGSTTAWTDTTGTGAARSTQAAHNGA